MENLIILAFFVATNLTAYFLHALQKRKRFKRHIGEMVFLSTFIASIPIFALSYLLNEPYDYYIGVFGIIMFFLSINGFGISKILEAVDNHKNT